MALVGTEWVLHGLEQRPDLNLSVATIVEDVSNSRYRVRVHKTAEYIRVREHALRSQTDTLVTPTTLRTAMQQLNVGDDAMLRNFTAQFEAQKYDAAIATATEWTQSQLKR